jgi:hypothetical protein
MHKAIYISYGAKVMEGRGKEESGFERLNPCFSGLNIIMAYTTKPC